ncbi:MAG: insulinase family protein [Clostridia bacterium]|nr:insulinase family protein [Clostridia bacterium]
METSLLYPGVTLRTVREHKFKSDYLSVVFICSGELYDRAHAAILPQVLTRGCRAYPTEAALDGALLDLYDASLQCSGQTNGESFLFSFRLSVNEADFLPDGQEIRRKARDLFFSFIFDVLREKDGFVKRIFLEEKKNLLERLNAEKVNKPRYAVARCLHFLCENEPLDYQTKDLRRDIRKVTAKSLYDYYLRVLREARVEVFYYGREERESVEKDLKARLAPLDTEKRPYVRDVFSPLKPAVMRKTERLEAHQSTLCVGYKTALTGAEDQSALALTRELLCISPTSLIFENLREKQSLCYSCADKLLPRKGVYLLYAGIDGRNAKTVEETLDRQLDTLISGNFSTERLENGKRAIINALLQMNDSPAEIEGRCIRALLSGREDDPEAAKARVAALGKEDVMRAAASLKKDSVFLLYGVRKEKKNP